MTAAAEVAQAYTRLPDYVRNRYTREAFYQALAAGEDLNLAPEKKATDADAPPPQSDKP